MQISIVNEITSIRKDVPKLTSLSDEHIFALVCYKYFFNNGEFSYKDYIDIFVDGKSDGGIDLIQVVEDSNDQVSLNLIQSKYISSLGNYNEIIDIIRKIVTTYNDFQNGEINKYSSKLKQKFKDKLASIEDVTSTNVISIFIGTTISKSMRDKIEEQIKGIEYFESFSITTFDENDVINRIQAVLEPKRFVDEAKIKIAHADGKIKYSQNGILVNVYASSLKDLFDRFKDRGLFEQNFRYFVKNKKIDDNIKLSLSNKKDRFWFLNNGIIIGCKDYIFDTNNVKLYNFSIINGCQTTTLIGQFDGLNSENDFVLPCKILKPDEGISDDKYDQFISEIAESSNSQKPISDRDLKSNTPEQRRLQIMLKEVEPRIYLEIKRGEMKRKNIERWQSVTNDVYGQLILAFNLQQPGTARSFKKKIFGDENIYYKVFKRTADKTNIVDLLKLDDAYEYFIKTKMDNLGWTPDYENVATNGKLAILALISFLIKKKRNLIDLNEKEKIINCIQQDNLVGGFYLIHLPDDYEENQVSLFVELISELVDIFKRKEDVYKTVSNFFKADKYYYEDIIPHIINRYTVNPIKQKEINAYLEKIFI